MSLESTKTLIKLWLEERISQIKIIGRILRYLDRHDRAIDNHENRLDSLENRFARMEAKSDQRP